ncbi:MAG TPA: glutaredoxin domain-containing protein [Polyangiaceae bacterium]|nr:glutaredoxin domain-containing protein [Polyangiaceae bacterium]
MLGGLLAAILLVSGSAIAYRAFRNVSTTIALEPPTTDGAPPAERVASPSDLEAPTPDSVAPAPLPTAQLPVEPLPAEAPLGEPIAAAPGGLPPAAPAPSVASRPPPTEAELRAALQATPIVMYSASWCGVCRKAKAFLSANGLQYREIDADETPGGWDKIAALSGQRGVPLIIVDGEMTQAGLSPSQIMQAVSHSVERRLGVKGIRVQLN